MEGETYTIQTYENSMNLAMGDPVTPTRTPVSILLGPGNVNNVVDGLQRTLTKNNQINKWYFEPILSVEELVTGGDCYGTVRENKLIVHRLMIPPQNMGIITYIAPAGYYTMTDTTHNITMGLKWPIRSPLPHVEKRSKSDLLYTGIRTIDALFPCVKGTTAAVIGDYGTGKSTLLQHLAMYSNVDCVVYVNCGEKASDGTSMIKGLKENFVRTHDGTMVSVLHRTCIVANTSNQPIASREPALYTGMTLAEHFRDMGLSVLLLVDNLSRWVEALKEIQSHIAEQPTSSGYPAYLGARIASYFERAGCVDCLGHPLRSGSITLVTTVAAGIATESTEQTVSAVYSIATSFYVTSKQMAERGIFPALDTSKSFLRSRNHQEFPSIKMKKVIHYPTWWNCIRLLWIAKKKNNPSECLLASLPNELIKDIIERILEDEDEEIIEVEDPELPELRRKCKDMLVLAHEKLNEAIQVAGKWSLPPFERISWEVANMIQEDFLHQDFNSFHDRYCPFHKTTWMLRILITFHDMAQKCVQSSNEKITWDDIKEHMAQIIQRIRDMKFEPKQKLIQRMKELQDDLVSAFKDLEEKF